MDKHYKQIVTVFINATREKDEVYYGANLVNFSGFLSFGHTESDVEVLDESIKNWFAEIEEHIKTEARFSVTLRRESEPGAEYYDVVNVEDIDGVLPRG
jgi:predicted RNase H-like HicB family nuclease